MNVMQILNDKGREIETASPDAPISQVAGKLVAHRIGAIVLVEDAGQIAGIVSERDIVRAVAAKGGACLNEPVRTIMTKNVITCSQQDTAQDLMGMMTAGRFRHLPVVDGETLVGIVSIGDVVKNHIAEVEMEATALKNYVAGG
ncbi:MAG: CBS domain-containing protein [Hyphomicrobiaceae bacterium]|nr:CBS domain-containing protein [Hyphomicrobiaceae bacterium]